MPQRYDLKKMLAEIQAEEIDDARDKPAIKLTQDDIKALLLKKRAAAEARP